MEEFNIIPNENPSFLNSEPPPQDTGIPLKHGYIFIKEVDTPNGILYHGGGGGTFGTWGKGDEGDKI